MRDRKSSCQQDLRCVSGVCCWAGTPEGRDLSCAQHARISRDIFKRNSKGLYDEFFVWEDDDIDDSKPKKSAPKNVIGAAWNEVAGVCLGARHRCLCKWVGLEWR